MYMHGYGFIDKMEESYASDPCQSHFSTKVRQGAKRKNVSIA